MDVDEAWMAGMMDGMGTFFVRQGASCYVLKSTFRIEAIQRFADLAGLNVHKGHRGGIKVQVQGDRLHELMKRLWPGLSRQRKAEYAIIRRKASTLASR